MATAMPVTGTGATAAAVPGNPAQQRVGMNHAAFGACELGRQLRQKKLLELKARREMSQSKASMKMSSFNRMRRSYSKQRPLFMEMLKTEREYVDSLHLVVSRFMLPLQVALENYPAPVFINKKEMADIFGNIAQLFEVNLELLRIIENNLGIADAEGDQRAEKKDDNDLATAFAEAFTNMLPVFKAFYSVYANNYEKSIDVMEECRIQNPMFRKFLEVACRSEDLKGLDLGDFLIKPVQRICKYPLFFRGLLECTDESHPMHVKLKAAAQAVARIADQVNQTGREAANAMRSFEIANQLEGLDKYDPSLEVVAPGRRFELDFQCKLHYSFQAPGAKPTKEMRHAPHKKKPREFFLFTDALLIAKSIGNEKLEFRFWLELENILITIPPSHSNGNGGPEGLDGAHASESTEHESFSAAQKRLPLDIVRIRIISNEKEKPEKKLKNNKASSSNSSTINNSPGRASAPASTANNAGAPSGHDRTSISSIRSSDSFSSSSARSLDPTGQDGGTSVGTTERVAPLTMPPRSPSHSSSVNNSTTSNIHKRSSSAAVTSQTHTSGTGGVPVVEKYTLWFKSGKERTRVFQRIVELQADLEQLKEQRASCLNQVHKASLPAAYQESTGNVPLPGHGRSNTQPSPNSNASEITGASTPQKGSKDNATRTA